MMSEDISKTFLIFTALNISDDGVEMHHSIVSQLLVNATRRTTRVEAGELTRRFHTQIRLFLPETSPGIDETIRDVFRAIALVTRTEFDRTLVSPGVLEVDQNELWAMTGITPESRSQIAPYIKEYFDNDPLAFLIARECSSSKL